MRRGLAAGDRDARTGGYRSRRLIAQQHRHRPGCPARRTDAIPDRLRRLRGPGGRAEPGHRRRRWRHLWHGRVLPAGPRLPCGGGRRRRGPLFRPLRPRHADPGIAADGSRPAAGRSSHQVETRRVRAPPGRVAGVRRAGAAADAGPSGPAGGLLAIRAAASDVASACGGVGAGTAGAARRLRRSSDAMFPCGDLRHAFGLGTQAKKAGPTTCQCAAAKPESPGIAFIGAAARPMANICAGCAAKTSPHATVGALAEGQPGDRGDDGGVHRANRACPVHPELFEHDESWPIFQDQGATSMRGIGGALSFPARTAETNDTEAYGGRLAVCTGSGRLAGNRFSY